MQPHGHPLPRSRFHTCLSTCMLCCSARVWLASPLPDPRSFDFSLPCGVEYLPLLIGHLFWSERTGLLRRGDLPSFLPSLSSLSSQATTQPARQGAPKQGLSNCAGLLSYLFSLCVKDTCVRGHLACFMGSLFSPSSKYLSSQSCHCHPHPSCYIFTHHCLVSVPIHTPSQATGQ